MSASCEVKKNRVDVKIKRTGDAGCNKQSIKIEYNTKTLKKGVHCYTSNHFQDEAYPIRTTGVFNMTITTSYSNPPKTVKTGCNWIYESSDCKYWRLFLLFSVRTLY